MKETELQIIIQKKDLEVKRKEIEIEKLKEKLAHLENRFSLEKKNFGATVRMLEERIVGKNAKIQELNKKASEVSKEKSNEMKNLILSQKLAIDKIKAGIKSNLGLEGKRLYVETSKFKGKINIQKETENHISYSFKGRDFGINKEEIISWSEIDDDLNVLDEE